ncbi:FlgN protein [Pelosinus fermentans]|uniref:flagellar protein FlgN n=1 Tax=Pelosinus fermentans TaxID=365349 RepID=UPI0002685E9B|nr:flagellar protein FlgN [Pelosinus fermentans]OAM92838.1 FlgN family protein [Pelosinus fermentans DSM 17108]SDQ58488.1 FlgN protein [Pelosinus fermentans]
MKDKWGRLTAVLEKMLIVYQAIFELSLQKREVLVQSNVPGLETIMIQEENVCFEVTRLDKIRKSIIKELAAIYGITDPKITLSQLVQVADQEDIGNVKNVEQELTTIILKISEVNNVNKQLVEQGLLIVNYSLNLLAQSTVGPTYHPNEKASFAPPNKSLFDSKA